MRLRNKDLAAAAKEAGLEEDDLAAIITGMEESSDSDTLARRARDAARPKVTGHIDWTNPAIKRHYKREGLRPVTALDREALKRLDLRDIISYLVPKAEEGVDLRPFPGSAGGYDCTAALDDIREMGVCEEFKVPPGSSSAPRCDA